MVAQIRAKAAGSIRARVVVLIPVVAVALIRAAVAVLIRVAVAVPIPSQSPARRWRGCRWQAMPGEGGGTDPGGGSNPGNGGGSGAGSGTCATPVCSGDAIQCAQLFQQWRAGCQAEGLVAKSRATRVIAKPRTRAKGTRWPARRFTYCANSCAAPGRGRRRLLTGDGTCTAVRLYWR